MLSVGTGDAAVAFDPPRQAGVKHWAKPVLDLMMLAQARATHNQLRYLMNERYHRVDFRVPDRKTWAMDRAGRIEALVHLGHQAAHEQLENLRPRFFDGVRQGYEPFPTT